MRKVNDQKIYRILDANLNRSKEALRVCEDICRFCFDAEILARKFKDIRHELKTVMVKFHMPRLLKARDVSADVGRKSIVQELKRSDVKDIFGANIQRLKESLRVLEEFAKLINPKTAEVLKKMRYQVYALEQKSLKGL